jgi:hypothetical protein
MHVIAKQARAKALPYPCQTAVSTVGAMGTHVRPVRLSRSITAKFRSPGRPLNDRDICYKYGARRHVSTNVMRPPWRRLHYHRRPPRVVVPSSIVEAGRQVVATVCSDEFHKCPLSIFQICSISVRRSNMKASRFVLGIIRNGYTISFVVEPPPYNALNTMSTLNRPDFVTHTGQKLFASSVMRETSVPPHCCNSLSVATTSTLGWFWI